MSICCVIPAKPYAESKTRLAACLSAEQRARLSRDLLWRTVRLAQAVVGWVVVVSRDPHLLESARSAGACGLLERSPGLNPALNQAVGFARLKGASGALILPIDLPLLSRQDLEAMLAWGETSPAAVIAPCHRGTGTNALLVRPSHLIPFRFGPGSFGAHCAAARAAGVDPMIYRADGVAFDLDTPSDWVVVQRMGGLRDEMQP